MMFDITYDSLAVETCPIPITPVAWVTIRREPRAQEMLVTLPSGDSYDVTAQQLLMFLKNVGFKEFERCVDYVWNFYTVLVQFHDQRYLWYSEDDLNMIEKQLLSADHP